MKTTAWLDLAACFLGVCLRRGLTLVHLSAQPELFFIIDATVVVHF